MALSLLLLACAPLTGVQDDMDQRNQADRMRQEGAKVDYASLEEMLGADVRLDPSAEERREAAEDDEMAEGPTGSVKDLVLDTNGRVRYAALSVGGFLGIGDKVALVPVARIRHDKTEDGMECRLGMTEAEIKALPEFDVDEAKEGNRLASMVRTVDAGYYSEKERTGTRQAGMGEHELILASTLLDLEVHGTDGQFGTMSNAVVDPNKNRVDYVIVSRGGAIGVGDEKYLIPMKALSFASHGEEDDDEPVLKAGRSIAQLESCVRYEEPEEGFVDQDALRRTDADFGIQREKDRMEGEQGMEGSGRRAPEKSKKG